MHNIKIQDNEPFTGSVEWLKNQIENMVFRFGKRDGVPTVDYAFKKIDEETGKTILSSWKTAAIMNESPEVKYNYYDSCDEYNETYITSSSANVIHEYGWAMFPYLSPNAQRHCNRLIRMLADELIKKVQNDRGELKIKVTVE